jgi:predicted enzyme related to lactoylglutathione lyase
MVFDPYLYGLEGKMLPGAWLHLCLYLKKMQLKLLVIRSANPAQLAQFYTHLGCTFEQHRHGTGPLHYSCTIDKMVLEIYPLAKGQVAADPNLRLGFEVEEFEVVLEKLIEQGGTLIQAPYESEFGWMGVVEDLEGRKVELYKK